MRSPSDNEARGLATDERGLSAVEYLLLLVLLVGASLSAWSKFGASMSGALSDATGTFDANLAGVAGAGSESRPGFTPGDGVMSGVTVTVIGRDAGRPPPADHRDVSDER
jgi:Flp pilus assembly pilin Flp